FSRAYQAHRRMSDAFSTRRDMNQCAAEVAGAQPSESEVGRTKVIDSRLQIRQVAADDIQLELIQRAGAGGRAKVNCFVPILLDLCDAGGEVEDAREVLQDRRGFAIRERGRLGDRG